MIRRNSKKKSSSKNLLLLVLQVDDDIHVHAALEVQSKVPTKKLMMIQESTMHGIVAVHVDTSDMMLFDYGQTRTPTNGVAHVIKNEDMKLTATNIASCNQE